MSSTIRPLTEALAKKSESELCENIKRTPSDIEALRQWMSKQPHLANIKATDQWLVAFLRGCKFSLERTKEKLDMYYTMRSIVPELFSNRDPLDPKIQEVLKIGPMLPVSKTEKEDSSRPCIIRLGVHDSNKLHLSDLIKVSFMVTEILFLEDDNFVIAGQESVLDLDKVSYAVIGQFSPGFAKKVTMCMEKASPVRQRAHHMLNTPPGFETVFTLFKNLLSERNREKVQVHNKNFEALYRHVPRYLLPKEYGGETGTLQDLIDQWKGKVESYREWFIAEDANKSNEKKRPGKPKTSQDLFGIDGSFRKLEFD